MSYNCSMVSPQMKTTVTLGFAILFIVLSTTTAAAEEQFDELQEQALAALAEGEVASALEYYTAMHELDPENGEIAYNRGSLLIDLGRYGEAVRVLTLAIDFGETTVEAYFNRAIALAMEDDPLRALEDLDRALELDENNPPVLNNLGVILARLGRTDEAFEAFLTARDADPAYAEPRFHLGNILYDRDELELAEQMFTEALEIAPEFEQARFNRGNTRYLLEQYAQAIDDFLSLLTLRPDDTDVLVNLGLAALAKAESLDSEDERREE